MAAAHPAGPEDPNAERSTEIIDKPRKPITKEDRIEEEKIMAEWEQKQGLKPEVEIEK